MTPPVAPRTKVRSSRAPVGRQGDRDLDDPELGERGPHHHLAGELHACRAQAERQDARPPERAHPAMEVAARAPEQQIAQPGEDRVPDVSIQRRHRAGLDTAEEAVPHHELGAAAQRADERFETAEVVAVVGVGHHDELRTRGRDAGEQRAPVPLDGDVDHAGAQPAGDLLRAVGAAVVGDDHLAVDREVLHGPLRLGDAGGQRLGLVETREHDAQIAHPLDT